ncbi:hypothetical protein TcasGA2_TC014399 [Tribolium castaneum]|uniref:Uncharacterized protein n=1 Tax=Tribolium castaneum TaxID=7070 RepID=D6WLR9_TRICA|nr:hypothetical protein TcasGA2_TC014399 [Tribolium castaneum]
MPHLRGSLRGRRPAALICSLSIVFGRCQTGKGKTARACRRRVLLNRKQQLLIGGEAQLLTPKHPSALPAPTMTFRVAANLDFRCFVRSPERDPRNDGS